MRTVHEEWMEKVRKSFSVSVDVEEADDRVRKSGAAEKCEGGAGHV